MIAADKELLRSVSPSLDLLRGVAALSVVLYHAAWHRLDAGLLGFMTPMLGHSAVVVFFVLSGFVIAATTPPEQPALDYAIKRIARVYSVALPAVLLIMLLNYVSQLVGVTPPDAYELGKPIGYFGLSMLFAGDAWSLAISAFGIGPYWSLNYEVWYYVIFGVAVFTRGAARIAAVAAVLLLVGPKIAILFPVWLTGAGVCALSRRRTLPRDAARVVAAIVLIALVAFADSGWAQAADAASAVLAADLPTPLRFSRWFLADYVRAILSGALIWGLCGAQIGWPAWLERWGRRLADVSFSLYLLHYPLMEFFKNMLPGAGPVAAVLAVSAAIGFGTVFEPQRDRIRGLLRALARQRVPRRT